MGSFCFRDDFNNSRHDSGFSQDQDIIENTLEVNVDGQKSRSRIHDFATIQVQQLGQGSYGKVYLVEHKPTKRQFAMKILSKKDIRKDSQIRHITDERIILERVNNLFLVKLRYAFQTTKKLILIVDYMSGGELFYHLKKKKRFSENLVRFYAAEMALGIAYLHSQNIIYRDLKPENVLLDEDGHIRLADFGLSKVCYNHHDKVFTMCGTPEYVAPEVLSNQGGGYDKTCDWWSYGCLLFEMFTGQPPFYSTDKREMLKNRMKKPIQIPETLSLAAKSFLQGLLQINPQSRLGYNGIDEVKSHVFFNVLDWNEVEQRKLEPPEVLERQRRKSGFFNQSDPTDSEDQTNTKDKCHFVNFTYEGDVQARSKQQNSNKSPVI